MSSSISSSEWRRFFRLCAGTAVLAVAVIYAFVVLVDPFDTLPLSPPITREPVASNARFAFPSLARSHRFDSAIFGTSTSRLLRPALLDREFGARFANLAMDAATAYEQSRMMAIFRMAHPAARLVLVGLDVTHCIVGDTDRFTQRPFPAWMYEDSLWRGYREMFNLHAVEEAGHALGVLIGIRRPAFGSDGYASFVPPDSTYDPARAATHFRNDPVFQIAAGVGDPASWHYPSFDRIDAELSALAPATRKILFFVPYNQRQLLPPDAPGAEVWRECKRRAAALVRRLPNALALDFMRPSPVTSVDDNYWDSLHYRSAVADRIVRDLAAANHGAASPDYLVLGGHASTD